MSTKERGVRAPHVLVLTPRFGGRDEARCAEGDVQTRRAEADLNACNDLVDQFSRPSAQRMPLVRWARNIVLCVQLSVECPSDV